MMKLSLDRAEADAYATRSTLLIDGAPRGFVLEPAGDGGATGIVRAPAGQYQLELKPIGTSRFDAAAQRLMREADQAHRGMIRLRDVPGRSEILIHWGNFYTDTEGCLLLGLRVMVGPLLSLAVASSIAAYKRAYPSIAAAILGEGAVIEIAEAARC